MDDLIKLEEELDAFVNAHICTDEQRLTLKKALNSAYETKRANIIDNLARQRMLEFLGHPKEKLIADHLQELTELMPDLSRQQLHLVLRHFGYDFEKALEALCERDKLPLELRIVLRVHDTFDEVKFYEHKLLPSFNDDHQEINDQAIKNEDNHLNNNCDVGFDAFDLKALSDVIKLLEKNEDEIEVDGKLMLRQTFQQREKKPTEEEMQALRAASLRYAEIEESASDDEDMEHEEDKKLASEVGRSGRFNRPNISMDPYEDEYDDTFDHAQLYSQVDTGATTIDERENLEVPRKRNTERAPTNGTQKSGNKEIRNKASDPRKEDRQKPKPQQKAGETSNSTSESKKSYTGGRERQLKERNKGKERQKGADRKARKNPF